MFSVVFVYDNLYMSYVSRYRSFLVNECFFVLIKLLQYSVLYFRVQVKNIGRRWQVITWSKVVLGRNVFVVLTVYSIANAVVYSNLEYVTLLLHVKTSQMYVA